MQRKILEALSLGPIPGMEPRQGAFLKEYCRELAPEGFGKVIVSGRDGYAVALTEKQAQAAFLVPGENQVWILVLPGDLHRRQWVKDIVDIEMGKGEKQP